MKWILMTAIMLSLFACNSSQTHDTGDSTNAISLNDGEKWVVNAEMRPFIQKGNDILTDYIDANGTDYQTLAKDLKAQNTELIKSCTMKGKSHDELHKWLHPHMDMISKLAKAENLAAANRQIEQLKASFNTYHTYFK